MSEHARAPRGEGGRRGRLHRLRSSALAFEHDDVRLVEAFDAARERAITPVRDEGDTAPKPRIIKFERAALAAYSALVLGEREQARTRISALAAERTGVVIGWLIGRYYAWTGDVEAASWVRPVVEALRLTSSMSVDEPDGRTHRDPLLAPVTRALIAVAEAVGDADLTGSIRGLAAGADPDRSVDVALCRLADVSGPTGGALEALTGLLEGRTAQGVAGWESIARQNREPLCDWILPLLAAGILGIDPDAERGRLRLRLHAPETWPRWRTANIRVGDSAVDVQLDRDGADVIIGVDQTAGALPLTLILEPTVHAPVDACFVDGLPAELALRPFPDRVIVPVQLALDAPRELRIRLAAG